MMEEEVSGSEGDYLKIIYALSSEGSAVSTSSVADRLGISAPAVTGMVHKLASRDPPLLLHTPYKGASLTAEGRDAALRLLRRHRLIERFLVEILGYRSDEVHEEAEVLEHVVTARIEERLATLLGNPKTDPHGAPIPDHDLNVPIFQYAAFLDLETGATAVVRRIGREDGDFLRYLAGVGIELGTVVHVVAKNPIDDSYRLFLPETSRDLTLGVGIVKELEVERS